MHVVQQPFKAMSSSSNMFGMYAYLVLTFVGGTEGRISFVYCMAMHDGTTTCAADHMVRNPRTSPFIFTY